MGKKVVVITGSPRKGGNSDLLAEAFITAAEARGHSEIGDHSNPMFVKMLCGMKIHE